jgi:hypothetical protein
LSTLFLHLYRLSINCSIDILWVVHCLLKKSNEFRPPLNAKKIYCEIISLLIRFFFLILRICIVIIFSLPDKIIRGPYENKCNIFVILILFL